MLISSSPSFGNPMSRKGLSHHADDGDSRRLKAQSMGPRGHTILLIGERSTEFGCEEWQRAGVFRSRERPSRTIEPLNSIGQGEGGGFVWKPRAPTERSTRSGFIAPTARSPGFRTGSSGQLSQHSPLLGIDPLPRQALQAETGLKRPPFWSYSGSGSEGRARLRMACR